MLYCLTSCLDFFVYFPRFCFSVQFVLFWRLHPVCFLILSISCLCWFSLHFDCLPRPDWLHLRSFPSMPPPPICSMAAMLQCGLSKHYLYCLSVPGVFSEFLLCSFLHFAWFWSFGFYLCGAGFVCVHGLISWFWPTPALQMVSGTLIWTCCAVMSVNMCLFVVKYGCLCDPTHTLSRPCMSEC